MGASLGFLHERLSKSTENYDHSQIIYHNDDIVRVVKTK